MKKILCLSNGHGEDLNASQVLKALRSAAPHLEIAALPLVGAGNAYRSLDIPIIGSTQNLPSGGFFYMDYRKLLADFQSGLVGLTIEQLKTILTHRHHYDLVFAVGDILPQLFAYLTGLPYVCFTVSSSAYYEDRVSINPLMRSSRCLEILTRDNYSATHLQKYGVAKAFFVGYPVMDVLQPTGQELFLQSGVPLIALLPGSRPPEATHNFGLLLNLCIETAQAFAPQPVQFRAALVPSMMPMLPEIAASSGWQDLGQGKLQHLETGTIVLCFDRAFGDILQACDLVVGMAGTAVEQSVGLGKPVIQIVGQGPQFTYRFAEAQMRLLGDSVKTVGTTPATPEILRTAAQEIKNTLADAAYLAQCQQQGSERMGTAGGSLAIAKRLIAILETPPNQ
jgi:uncharacterized protein (TIGR03492 family)